MAISPLVNNKGSLVLRGEEDSYVIIMNQNKNKLSDYSMIGTITTELGNKINVRASNGYDAGKWLSLGNMGAFENRTPINGMKTIRVVRDNDQTDLAIRWNSTYYGAFSTATLSFNENDVATFDFNGDKPNYIKLENISSSYQAHINSAIITYSCIDEHHEVKVEENYSNRGSVTGGGDYAAGKEVTITATPNEGYEFVGWYVNDNDTAFVSTDSEYTFIMPNEEVNYKAGFDRIMPALNTLVEYGTYPQTLITNETVIKNLNSLAGFLPSEGNNYKWTTYPYSLEDAVSVHVRHDFIWYQDIVVGSEKYRGVYFTSYRPFDNRTIYHQDDPTFITYSYQDENGYFINTAYWFKYEPITWRVADHFDDGVSTRSMLVSEVILDATYYNSHRYIGINVDPDYHETYPNNYKHSDIREFINGHFYDAAFSTVEKNAINETLVINDAASTGYENNPYACQNTNDKVFLLSTGDYGHLSKNLTQLKDGTDYARCLGLYHENSEHYWWWLRSPSNRFENNYEYAHAVNHNSFATPEACIYFSNIGLAPSIWVNY